MELGETQYSNIFFEPTTTIQEIFTTLKVEYEKFYLILFTSAVCPLCEKQYGALNRLKRVFMNRLEIHQATMSHDPTKRFAKEVLGLKVVPSMIIIKDAEIVVWHGIQRYEKIYNHLKTRANRCGNCNNRAKHRRKSEWIYCRKFSIKMLAVDGDNECFK